MAKLLLATVKGADVNKAAKAGQTPLYLAIAKVMVGEVANTATRTWW